MNEELLKTIGPQLAKLPDDIKNAIANNDMGGKLAEIAKSHHLHIDQAAALEMETMLVMVGLESSDDYINNLGRELRLSKDQALEITADVNKKIFADLRSSLRMMADELKKEDEEENEQIRAVEDHSHIKKEDLLREIERHATPTPPPARKPASGGLYNIGSKLRDREFEVVTDAKRMDDMRRVQLEEDMADEAGKAASAKPSTSDISMAEEQKTPEVKAPMEAKLTEVVREPMKQMEVKLPEEKPTTNLAPAPAKIDPYREQVG